MASAGGTCREVDARQGATNNGASRLLDQNMIKKGDCAPVSVVIPCFRCAVTIERALASVAQQSIRPSDIILVDDASGDGTLAVLHALEVAYPGWVKVLQLEENRGAAGARNAGWAVASQSYIAFLDADDAWHPKKIEIQYAYMRAHPEVVLCGHGHRLLNQDDVVPDWVVTQCDEQRIYKWTMLWSNKFVTPSAMVRRDVAYRFVEKQRHMEDHMLWLKIICSGACVVKLSAELAVIYKGPFGVMGLSSQMWLMERGDLENYHRLYRAKLINGFQWAALSMYSLLKYVRRLLLHWGYLRWKR
jgi:glycosyltransferase involved in cell wall biosynthesis